VSYLSIAQGKRGCSSHSRALRENLKHSLGGIYGSGRQIAPSPERGAIKEAAEKKRGTRKRASIERSFTKALTNSRYLGRKRRKRKFGESQEWMEKRILKKKGKK